MTQTMPRPHLDGLARHLIVALVLFSSLITTVITAIELYSDYRNDLSSIDNRLRFIRESYLPTLVESVWVADSIQITTQLEGLARLQDIEYLAIDIAGKKQWSAGIPRSQRHITREYQLQRNYRGSKVTIGTLQVVASIDNVLDRLKTKLLITLLSNLAKTLLVASFMLYLFQRLAGRHLERIAQHLQHLGHKPESDQPLQLDRPALSRWRPDSLDQVVSVVNTMQHNIRDAHGQLLALNADLEHRVTERTHDLELSKNEAEQASAAKSEFLSRMSHELRTPLNAVIGFGQLLEEDTTHPLADTQRKDVGEIVHAGNHLLKMINEMLDLARIESGRLEISQEPIALAPLIEACVAQLKPLAAQRSINITLDLSAHCAVRADPTRLEEVLLNLLSNAVKYNRESGHIQVRCTAASEQHMRISVRDTGLGIAAADLPRLFKPFERLGSSYSSIEGTGIGLALSKRLIEAMHGKIGVDSVQDEGSTFWIELPLASLDARISKPVAAPVAPSAISDARHKMLYIEDNPANLRLVQKIFAAHKNIEFLDAANGKDGLTIAVSQHPDLILLDINLPDMDGFEVLRQLRENPLTRNITVIAVTANAMPREVERGNAAGFSDYLTKPLDVPRLLALIDQLLNRTEKAE